jgi:DNA-binding transcriptional LysR family regulator
MDRSSLRQLDIFAQLVASGSLRHCARDLGIGADMVAREIDALELRLGYQLFDRDGDRARPTQAGIKTARALTLLSDDAPAPSEPTPPAPPEPPLRPIVLAAPAPVFGHFQEALAAFEAANEDVAITLDLGVHLARDAAAGFARGRIDIAYFYALEQPEEPAARYGWSEQLNLYAGERHSLAASPAATSAEIVRAGLLAMEPRNGLRRIADDALGRAGIRPGPPVMESDNMFDIVEALRAGEGLFPAFGPIARDLGRIGGIRRIALEIPLPPIGIWQAIRPAAQEMPAVGALAEFLFL